MAKEQQEVINKKYRGVPKKIARELETYETQYFKEDLPIPFCGSLMIYPAAVRDFEVFSICSACLTLDKNKDPKGIAMSQLEYLYSKTQIPGEEGSMWSYRIQRLFEIIFHIKNGIKCLKCGEVIEFNSPVFKQYIESVQTAQQAGEKNIPQITCPREGCGNNEKFIEMMKFIEDPETHKHVLCVDGQIINKEDYERLRYIVLYQNFPDYQDDSWVDPAIKQDYEARMKLERQKNDLHATIEKKIVCLGITTSWTLEYIYSMSIRKFTMALTTVDDLINYKIMKTASLSGFVQWPKDKPIEHWIYKPDKDMYGDAYKSMEDATKGLN